MGGHLKNLVLKLGESEVEREKLRRELGSTAAKLR
jgi:hypothetical protein